MQEKYFTHDQFQSQVLDKRPKNANINDIVDTFVKNGYTIQGVNDNKSQQKDGSLLDKLSQRVQNVKTTNADTTALPAEKRLNVVGQAAGAVGDVVGSAVSSVAGGINDATGGVIGNILGSAGSAILDTELGKAGIENAKRIEESYATWKKANPNAARDLENVVNIAAIFPTTKVAESAAAVAPKIAETTSKSVRTNVDAFKAIKDSPIVSGTGEVLKSVGRTLKSIPENVATNVGEIQAQEAAIKSIPSVAGQKAVREGIDVADVKTLQEVIKTPKAKELIDTIKRLASGDTSASPFEIIGKPVIARLKDLEGQVNQYANELGNVAKSLKGQTIKDLTTVQGAVLDGLDRIGVKIVKGGLDFVDSSLEGIGSSGKIIENVYKRIEKAKDASDFHNLKKYIDSNISFGKKVEGLDGEAERILKSWRKAIDDTLDSQFPEYNKVNTELAKRISPLEDLKDLVKGVDGLDLDLANEKAGVIMRRITSAAASRPDIQQILRNVDAFTNTKGKTLASAAKLQNLYNILNKYYDIAPKTGYQNQTKEAVKSAGGLIDQATEKIQGFAGSTNATRQKAFEDYLDELFTKTSKAKKKAN